MVANKPPYKPCIISNPKKRIVYVPMHSKNFETKELSDCDGYYPKEIDNYNLGEVGLFLKHSRKDIKKLEEMCQNYNNKFQVQIISPVKHESYRKPALGKPSFLDYLKENSNNILNPISFVLIYNKDDEPQFKKVPYYKNEILSSNSEEKIIEWTKDIDDLKYHEKSLVSLSELLKFYNSLKNKEELLQVPIEWAPYTL